ncbi:glucose 1-dehydrogenase [Noviherbaspirillum sp. L7-7A]|uniref:glucose 1-dehydrogenase n=1 Tax=Noviherbaspirillum sp. L7-7A TaxID=2850560 RepID=UPI001C2CA8FC|nr:glucose 1-dehydrogenase [Noviherbaspirillum sp. L7-7A]MBV0881533.1 glucose 1-dehydrogenase [Noviherbaspirillum sp. L7-7A]
MHLSFENKVALVTGAGSGIGLVTATAFAQAGAAVILADIDEAAVSAAAQALVAAGHKAMAIGCDVADEREVASMVEKTVATFGRLDVAFNNAGIQVPVAETADASGAHFDRIIATNLRGVWNCAKHALRHMRIQGSGAIVNTSSQAGLVGTAGLGAYTASKHGVIGLTKCAALEYAAVGIRINAICPGAIDTPMVQQALADEPDTMKAVIAEIPVARLGRSEEIASTVLWLCSPGAGFMTGQVIAIDGGFTIR